MSWVFDHASAFHFALAAVAAACFAHGWLTGRGRSMAYGVGVLALMALLWFASATFRTDQGRMIDTLDALARATEAGDADAILKRVTADFRFGSLDRDETQRRVRAVMQAHGVKSIHIWNQLAKVDGANGEVLFDLRADAVEVPFSAKASFVKDGNDWKLRRLEIYRFRTVERQFVPGVD